MATNRWIGGAAPTAQIATYGAFAGTWIVGETITVTMGQKVWAYAITSTTIATFLPLLVTAYNALSATTYPELLEELASSDATHFILTANNPGTPFAAVLSTNSASGTIANPSGVATVASSGPNDWSTAKNWFTGAVPATGDTVNIDNCADDIKYGIAQSGVTLAALNIFSTFTGTIGLSKFNTTSTTYPEYRQDYLAISVTTLNIGQLPGTGSQRIKIDVGTVQSTINVYNSDSGAETNLEAILLKGSHASNALNIVKGSVGFAVFGGETGTINVLDVGFSQSITSDSQVRTGPGVALGTINQTGGVLAINSAVTGVITQTNGQLTIWGTGAISQMTVGGLCMYNTSGALNGNTVVTASGFIDFDQVQSTFTLTNPIVAYNANPCQDTGKRCALVVDFKQVPLPIFGPNCRLTRGSVASN